MNRALIKKTLLEARLLWFSCAATLFAFCWVRVWIVSRLEMSRFQSIVENLPEDFERLSPVPFTQLITYPGRIGFTFEEPITYLIMAVWAISRSSDSVSGETDRGTMEMLLAQPISRRSALLTHASVTLIGVVTLAAAAFLGSYIGIQTSNVKLDPPVAELRIPGTGLKIPLPFVDRSAPTERPLREMVDAKIFVPAAVNYACFGIFLSGVTMLMSSWDRYRWRTIGIVVGFYILSTVLELTGLAVKSCRWMLNLTFFSVYEPVRFVTEVSRHPEGPWALFWKDAQTGATQLGPVGCDLVLFVLGLISLAVGVLIFCKRDIPAPI